MVDEASLISGKSKSCGCYRREDSSRRLKGKPSLNRLPLGKGAANRILYSYKKHAKERGVLWEIDDKTALEMMKLHCFYCGDPPKNRYKSDRNHGDFVYTGLDRIDNTKGYTLENTVPCCKSCNWTKGTKSLVDFIGHVFKIVKHISGMKT